MANNLSAFIPQVWSANVVQKLYRTNVGMAICANTDYEGEIQNRGDTVQVRTFGRVTTQPYARGQAISYESLAPTKEPLTINDAHMFAFAVDDLDSAQMDLNAIEGYSKEAFIAFNELIDTKIFSYVASAASANQLTSSGSAYTISAANAYTLIVDANAQLDLQNCPSTGRWMIVSPTWRSFLAKDTTYTLKGLMTADRVIQTARPNMTASEAPNYIGEIAGVDLYWSNNLPTDSSGNRLNPFGWGKPISYAAQLRNVEMIRLETTFASAVRGLILHDGTVFAEHAKRLGYVLSSN